MTPRYISRRYFRDACDYVLDFLDHEPNDYRKALPIRELRRLRRGSVIYLSPKADQELFFAAIFPKIDTPVFLVTGGTGHPNPGKHGVHLEAKTSAGEPKIAAWFCENKDRDDPRIVPIPIGVRQIFEDVIPKLQEQAAAIAEKKKLVCANFDPATAEERVELLEHLETVDFVDWLPYTPGATYPIYQSLLEYKFAFAPAGKGIDTYRCYEYLYLNIIPILKRSPISSLFDHLPVVLVDRWEEVTEDFLHRQYAKIQKRFGLTDGRSGVEFIRGATALTAPHHIERMNAAIRERGFPRPPLALDLEWLDSEERRQYKRVFDGWYHYDPRRDPTLPPRPAAARSAFVYLIRHVLYLGQRVWVEWIPFRSVLERLYEFIYVKPLRNGTSFSLGGYRVLKLFSRIVLQKHASWRSALASLPAFARAVSREDNTELAPDWIVESTSDT